MGGCPYDWQPWGYDANTLFLLKSNFLVALFFQCFPNWGKTMHEETKLMLKGYGLTTAEFFYRMPDHVHVLNSFIWQDYDIAPDHPRLFKFIEFWQEEIEGPLHSVRFTHRRMIGAGQWQNQVGEFHYH